MAANKVVVCSGGYAAFKMQKRNEYLVDHCDKLIAIYDGSLFGGTYNCVKYANSVSKQIIVIKP